MDRSTLARVIEILETDPDFYVPVQRIWRTLREEGLAPDMAPEALQAYLETDERFECIEGLDVSDSPAELGGEREELAPYIGPWIKLAARGMTTEDVLDGLSRSLRRLNETLRGAWEQHSEEDPEAGGALLQAMTMTEQLEQEMQELIKKHRERDAGT